MFSLWNIQGWNKKYFLTCLEKEKIGKKSCSASVSLYVVSERNINKKVMICQIDLGSGAQKSPHDCHAVYNNHKPAWPYT